MTINVKRGNQNIPTHAYLIWGEMICSASACALSAYQLEGDTANVGVELLISKGKAEKRSLASNGFSSNHRAEKMRTVAFVYQSLNPWESRG